MKKGKAVTLDVFPAPPRDATISTMCDWVELATLLSMPAPVAVMELGQALDLDVDRDPADSEEIDQYQENLYLGIGVEIERRIEALGPAYPFSTNQGQLATSAALTEGQTAYVISLILSHCAKGGLLPKKFRPSDKQLREARELFQICSTIAAAGHTGGPSFSVGWSPKKGASNFHAKLRYAWPHFGDGEVVAKVQAGVPKMAKDEGIDVLAFWLEKDRGPSQGYLVGQVASGANWKDKSARGPAEILVKYWLHPQPATQGRTATFVPFDVSENEMRRQTVTHGYLLSRLRLPAKVVTALQLSDEGLKPIERIEHLSLVKEWIAVVLSQMRAATA